MILFAEGATSESSASGATASPGRAGNSPPGLMWESRCKRSAGSLLRYQLIWSAERIIAVLVPLRRGSHQSLYISPRSAACCRIMELPEECDSWFIRFCWREIATVADPGRIREELLADLGLDLAPPDFQVL